MNKNIARILALASDLTTYHYKVILLLLDAERTQSQLSKELGINKQNVNKACKTLMERGIVSVSRTEGQLKYLKVNKDLKELPMQGQIKLLE